MIRVRVEIVSHGVEAAAEVLDSVLIINDGTGLCLGEDEGGIGNYEVHDNGTLEHLHNVDYPHMYACGFIKGIERTPAHRLFIAEQALGIVQEARKLEEEGKFEGSARVDRPIREFSESEQEAEALGDLAAAARRYAPELLGKSKVEREADRLDQETTRKSKRADEAEQQPPKVTLPDFLNIP